MKKFLLSLTLFALVLGAFIPAQASAKGYKVHVTKYRTSVSRVSHLNFSGLPTLTLGYGITAYTEGAAGTQGIEWNEGRWTIEILSSDPSFYDNPGDLKADSGLKLAKKVAAYLDHHRLPAPHQYGLIQLYADGRQSFITWQNKKKVYNVTTTGNPYSLFKWVVDNY